MPNRRYRLLATAVLWITFGSPAGECQTAATGPLLEAGAALYSEGLFDEAYRTFERVLALDSLSADAHAGAAWAALRAGRADAARGHARAAIRLDRSEDLVPARSLASAALTRLALDQGDVPEAFDWFGRSHVLLPLDDDTSTGAERLRNTLGRAYSQNLSHDLDEALYEFTALTPREDMLLALTWSVFDDETRSRLRAHLERLMGRSEGVGPALAALARMDLFSNPASSRRYLERLVALQPGTYRHLVALGEAQGRSGDAAAALATFRDLEVEHSDSTAVIVGLYRALGSTGARTQAQRYRARQGNGALFSLGLRPYCAARIQQDGRTVEAPTRADILSCHTMSLWLDPLNGEHWYWLGEDLLDIEEIGEGIRALTTAVELAPDSLDYRVVLGWARFRGGNTAAAITDINYVLRRDPRHAQAQLRLGVLYSIEGRHLEATTLLASAVSAMPNDADAHLQLGLARYSAGDDQEAIPALEMARTLAPQFAVTYRFLSLVYAGVGRREDALRALRELRALDADAAREAEPLVMDALATSPSASPLGEGWTYAAESSDTVYWAQTSSIRQTGSTLTVWVVAVASQGNERAFQRRFDQSLGATAARRVVRDMQRSEVNCTAQQARTHQAIQYDRAGDVVGQYSDPYPTWSYPVPGSVLESLVQHVCAAAR